MIEQLIQMREAIEVLAYVMAITSIAPSAFLYIRNTIREAREDRDRIYDSLDTANQSLNELILQYPHLGVSWFQDGPTRGLTPEE